jgi:hypothetical protein
MEIQPKNVGRSLQRTKLDVFSYTRQFSSKINAGILIKLSQNIANEHITVTPTKAQGIFFNFI